MSKGMLFWILMILWLIFGILSHWSHWEWSPLVNIVLLWVLLALLGWGIFGKPIT
jgi:hypothetical protein